MHFTTDFIGAGTAVASEAGLSETLPVSEPKSEAKAAPNAVIEKSHSSAHSEGGPLPWAGGAQPNGVWGGQWTDNRYEQVRHYRHWCYVAIARITELIAAQQPFVSASYGSLDDSDRPSDLVGQPTETVEAYFRKYGVPNEVRAKSAVPFQPQEELIPVDYWHPLNELLRNPNPVDSPYDLWSETLIHLLLTGSSYWWINRNAAGFPCELWVVPSQWVWANPSKDGLVESYSLRPVEGIYKGVTIPAYDMIHFRRKSPLSKWDGQSPLTAGSLWIDGVESIDKTRFNTFRNGIHPTIAIEFENSIDDPKLDRIAARLQARYVGENKAGTPFLIPPGASVKPLIITPRDMDFPGGFDQLRDSTLALFGVSPIIAGIVKDMTYGAITSAQMGFCSFTMNPLLAFLSQAITKHLACQWDDRLRVWWPKCVLDDRQQDEKELLSDIMAGAITVNEIRAKRGRRPWGTEYDQPIARSGQAGAGHTQIQGAGGGHHAEGGDKT